MKISKFLTVVIIIALSVSLNNCSTEKVLTSKTETKFHEKANKMNRKGALAVVGMAKDDISRNDIGRDKAISNAAKLLSEHKKQYVEENVHNFREAIGLGKSAEHNDLFKNVVDVVSVNILEGAMVVDFDYYVKKIDKKEGIANYIVLYVINPEFIYDKIKKEVKNSDEAVYTRWRDSEAKKEHDQKVKEYKKEFGVE